MSHDTAVKVRTKPADMHAIRFLGSNYGDVESFAQQHGQHVELYGDTIYIHTPLGTKQARVGHYLLADANDNVTPVSPAIFERDYEVVEEPQDDSA